MRKIQTAAAGHSPQAPAYNAASHPRSPLAPASPLSNWAPVALFAMAYMAVLAVLFAPEGYFLAQPAPASLAQD